MVDEVLACEIVLGHLRMVAHEYREIATWLRKQADWLESTPMSDIGCELRLRLYLGVKND